MLDADAKVDGTKAARDATGVLEQPSQVQRCPCGQTVWEELARLGKLKHIGHGLYELTTAQ